MIYNKEPKRGGLMKKYILCSLLIISANSFATQSITSPGEGSLAPHLRTTQAEKQAAVERVRDAVSVGKTVALQDNNEDSPSVRAVNSFGDFFEKRVKASNH